MLVMPIVHKSKIYNVEVKLKNAYEIQEMGSFQKKFESDIVVNGRSFNQSKYYEKDAPLQNTIHFIRDYSLYTSSSFLLTSRRNNEGKMKSFQVGLPLPYVTEGLDLLYSSVIQNMKKEIPGHQKDRNLSLKRLGIASHITDETLDDLQRKMNDVSTSSLGFSEQPELKEFFQTLDFMRQFDCTVIEDATIDVKMMESVLAPLHSIHTKEAKEMREYYKMAQDNSEEYLKLDSLSRILTGESFKLIKKEKNMMKIKSREYHE